MIGCILAFPVRVLNVAAVAATALASEAHLCDPPPGVTMLDRVAREIERAGDKLGGTQ